MKKDLLIILVLVLPAFAWLLQPGYFTMHDDLQAVRQMQMDQCFVDRQIPCRWTPVLGYGFGYPLFNFYPPLPYLIGQVFRIFNMQFIDIVKAVGVTGFILTAVFMYFLARRLFGRKPGIAAALLYSYAPYHSVDFYVRGAINEFWAMAFYPAILLSLFELVHHPRPKWILLSSLSIAGLMLSHNPMLMIFAPLAIVWTLYWLTKTRNFTALPALVASGCLGFGLAAFFTLPVIFEQQFVHIETLTIGYFNFLAHFLDISQIFFRINWGYGESVLGPGDTMSFALGYLQWLVPLLLFLAAGLIPSLRRHISLFLLLAGFTLIALFLSHSKATFIWQAVPQLQILQFPWRFLTLAVFFSSLLASGITLLPRSKFWLLVLTVVCLILNANYFRPRAWYPDMTDAKKFSGDSWRWQVTGSIFDYLPKWAPLPPADPAGGDVGIISGEGTYRRLIKNSWQQKYLVDITSAEAIIELQTFYFPGWQVKLDGHPVNIDPARDKLLGRMQLDVKSGTHTIEATFLNTPIRTAGNILSTISLVAVALLAFISLRPKAWMPKSP